MLKKILIGLAAVVVVFVVVVAMQPSQYSVQRSIKIAAPPAAVFPHVNSLRKWDAWSPWVKIDPQATMTFEGPESGAGAVCRWAGNREVGVGSMTITESKPPEAIKFGWTFSSRSRAPATLALRSSRKGSRRW